MMSYGQALNNLQHSHKGQLLAASIAIPTKHWLDFLPCVADGKINYPPPNEWELFQLFDRSVGQAWRTTMNNIVADNNAITRIFSDFFEREYTIFNWNTGAHWGSSLIHKRGAAADGCWSRIAQIAVMDPLHDDDTIEFVHRRLRDVLGRLGCTFAQGNIERSLWFPRQRDSYSCGLYAANINRILIEHIVDLYLPSGPKQYTEAAMWQPAREYFDPFEFQGQPAGLVALTLMREIRYQGRICVSIVKEVTNIAVDEDDCEARTVGPDPTAFSLTKERRPLPQKRQTPGEKESWLKGMRTKISRSLRRDRWSNKRDRSDDDNNDDGVVTGGPTKKQKTTTTTIAGAGPKTRSQTKGGTTSKGKKVPKKPASKKK